MVMVRKAEAGVHKYSHLHCNCSSVDASLSESPSEALQFFFFSPNHPCLYIYIFPLPVYIKEIWESSCAVVMGLNIPSGVTVRRTQGDEIGQSVYRYLPVHCM